MFNHHRVVADGRKDERNKEEKSKEKDESEMERERITLKKSIKDIFGIKIFMRNFIFYIFYIQL